MKGLLFQGSNKCLLNACKRLSRLLELPRGARLKQLITSGHVQVNGTTITELGSKADPETDHIRVNGKLLQREQQRHVYLLLNKPKGYVTTVSDPEDRPTVMDLLRGVRGRVLSDRPTRLRQ